MTATSLQELLNWDVSSLNTIAAHQRSCATGLADTADRIGCCISAIPNTELDGLIRLNGIDVSELRAGQIRNAALSLERLDFAVRAAASQLQDKVSRLRHGVEVAVSLGFDVNFNSGEVKPAPGVTASFAHEFANNLTKRVHSAMSEVAATDTAQAEAIRSHIAGKENPPHVSVKDNTQGAPIAIDKLSPEHETFLRRFPPQLLESSPDHSAIAFGDLESADTVFTLVPGTGSNVENIEGQLSRVAGLVEAAGGDPNKTAVVLWSYSAPQTIPQATSPEHYKDDTARLQNFQSYLADKTRGQTIVAGYSYGSTLVAQAAKHSTGGLHADRIMLIGSPGVGPDIHSTNDIQLRDRNGKKHNIAENKDRIAVAASAFDVIPRATIAEIHGQAPDAAEFGAEKLHVTPQVHSDARRTLLSLLYPSAAIASITAEIGENLRKAHTDHYFGSDAFTEETRRWLAGVPR